MNEDNNENLKEIENKKNEINDRNLSSGNKVTNFIKNPFGGLGKLLENGLSRKKEKSGIKEFFKRLPLKVKLIFIGILVFIVLVLVVIIAVGDNSTKKVVKNRSETVNNFEINDASTEMEKLAVELYNNYDSMLGFTTDQLNKMYEDFKNINDTELEYLVTSGKKEFGNPLDFGYSITRKRPLYEHILRTEKYNFNNINWRRYTHAQDDVEMNTTKVDNLELEVPIKEKKYITDPDEPEDDETIATLMKTTSPYILTNDIPLGLLTGLVSSGNSRSSEDQSRAQKFVYQSIKECLAKITVNKYILESVKFNTMHEVYDIVKYRQVDRFVGRAVRNEKGEITGYVTDYVGTVSKEVLDSKPGPEIDEIRESEKSYSYDTYWYVAKAKVYDADIVNNFDYRKYIDQDVEEIVNPDVTTLLYADPFERVIEGEKPSASGLGDGQIMDVTREYTAEVGAYNHYEKEWKDKLSPTSTDYNKYTFEDLKEYNTTEDEAFKKMSTDKKVMASDEFDSTASTTKRDLKDYEKEDKANDLFGLSIVDFMESNSGIYNRYLTKNSQYGTFIGLGRNKLKEGYKQTKNILNSLLNKEISIEGFTTVSANFNSATSGLASEKTLPFVYGSSLGYNVTMIFGNSTASAGISGMDLLKQYIHSLEGNTGEKEENGVKYYRVGLVAGNRTVGYGLDLETSGKERELIESASRAGITISTEDGAWIPADLVDAITDVAIDDWYNQVKSVADGLNLTEYQIHALTSRAYNAGSRGTGTVSTGFDFATAYRSFWNQDSDDKYPVLYEKYGSGEINSQAESDILSNVNYNHGLYTNYMSKPDNGGLLKNRRDSEWVLFQTGYYGYRTDVKRMYGAGGGGGSILECAEYIHQYMEENSYTYCVYGGNRYEECGKYGKAHGLNATFEESKTGYHNTCCATYVSWVLQDAGYMTAEEHTKYSCNGANNLAGFLQSQKGFIKITDLSSLEAGDILCYSGHIEIYAGNNTKYNAGSGDAIRRDSPYNFGTPSASQGILYGLRAPN